MPEFIDNEHRSFYETQVTRTHAQKDPYRKALFYTLGLTKETRRNIKSLYDFKENGIITDGLTAGWQTSTSAKVTRLAFNLYNGFYGSEENDECASNYTPYELFCCGFMEYMFEAVRLRYPEYYG